MLNRVCYGDDILSFAHSPNIKSAYIKWKLLSQRKTVALGDFLDTRNHDADKMSVLLSVDDDYYFLYCGRAYGAEVGVDLAGSMHSALNNRVAHDMRAIYAQIRETHIPVCLVYASQSVKGAVAWERLIFPILVNGEVCMLVRYNEPINSTSDVHNYLFQNSPHQLIIALPITDYDGNTVDADIIDINPMARKFYAADRYTERPIALRQLSPFFDDDRTWTMLTTRTSISQREHYAVDRRDGTTYKFIVVRLDYLLLLRIYPTATLELVTGDPAVAREDRSEY